ncbi:hypothetical protein [Variovorax sp.]|jgi:hypothetical protein|uniref:hypothetical protein n=1 Tax=Variovorax sp. TaxID=1871043 RepID=UPI0011F84860|nr:hypothetical protein [Variovorax sp.]TAJ64794.1 MAG: hypothetical protein EPO53_11470 [Variovorax sp.]
MKSRSTLVTAALDEVAMLRASDFRREELITAQLLREYGKSSDLTNQLWFDLSAELRVNRRRDISDLLGLWIWRTSDNGSRIRHALDDWLRACDDESKVWIALHREGVPFAQEGDLLERAAERFPGLVDLCREARLNR